MLPHWALWHPGDKVQVVRGISDMEKTLVGRVFELVRFDATHGYAVVQDEHGSWHVHPEALENREED